MIFNLFGENYEAKTSFPLGGAFPEGGFIPLDLSVSNPELSAEVVSTSANLGAYLDHKFSAQNAIGGYGGYNEKRALYRRSAYFGTYAAMRDVHLGIDIWLPAATPVLAVLPGVVHSFADNNNPGDYGPTIILQHFTGNDSFFTLYGHLSRASLEGLSRGQLILRKQEIGTLGDYDENGDWPPHLHFQIIREMGSQMGDFPGACTEAEKAHYLQNCPDPMLFLPIIGQKLMP